MFRLPPLPPMQYRLWIPSAGLYLKVAPRHDFDCVGTQNADQAQSWPEPEARAVARLLAQFRPASVVELRPVEPAAASPQRAAA